MPEELIHNSPYTGEQVDDAIAKILDTGDSPLLTEDDISSIRFTSASFITAQILPSSWSNYDTNSWVTTVTNNEIKANDKVILDASIDEILKHSTGSKVVMTAGTATEGSVPIYLVGRSKPTVEYNISLICMR